MRPLRFLGFGCFLVVFGQAGCGSGGGASSPGQTIRGVVTDVSGDAVSGVTVRLGDDSTKSNSKGEYELKTSEKRGTVRFEKSGYLPGLERVEVQDFTVALSAVLLPRGDKVTIDAEAGGEVTGARGSRVIIPEGSIVDSEGKAVEGDVDVYVTPIDPSVPAELTAAPGDFTARENGETTALESYGMVDITLEQDGRTLNVKDGEVFTAFIPAPANVSEPPTTMPLYSFDEEDGVWVLEGTATYSAEAGGYEAELPHLSTWNCDQPLEATCEKGKVVDDQGRPVQGARVRASGVDYSGQSEAVTDENGQFAVAVRRNSQVDIVAEHPEGGGQVRRVESGSAQTEIPPEVGDSGCGDGGTWIIEPGKFDSGGEKKDCSEYSSVFGDNECLADLGRELGKCEAKFEGSCRIEYSETGIVTTYGDGSKMVTGVDGTSSVYDPEGKLCYEMAVSPSETGGSAVYQFGDGQEYKWDYSDPEEPTLTCPSGESFKITKEQSQAISACQPDDSTDMPSEMGGAGNAGGCEVILPGSGGSDGSGGSSSGGASSGGASSDGGSPSSGGGPAEGYCANDTSCTGTEVCCDLGIGENYKICLDEATCTAAQGG